MRGDGKRQTLSTSSKKSLDTGYDQSYRGFKRNDVPEAKDDGLAGVFFWQIEQDNGYNLNAVNHVLGNRLVTPVSNGRPQDQIATCGENISVTDCQLLINPIH